VGDAGEQDATATFVVLLVAQVMSIQPLPAAAVCGVHVNTAAGPVSAVVQVMVTKLLPAFGDCATQVPAWTGVLPAVVVQTVCWWPLAFVAGDGVQVPTLVGPLTTVGVGQLVVVKPLLEVGPVAAHELTWTLLVSLLEHVVVVQLFPDAAAAFVQEAIGVGPAFTVLHVVAVQLLPELATTAEHDETPVGPVVAIGQVVAVQLLPALAATPVHDATGVAADVLLPQVVAV
jgi:hypothetical protein